jgi:hypothetical protein
LTLAVPCRVYKFFNPDSIRNLTIFPNDKPTSNSTPSATLTFESIVVSASTPMDFGTFKVSREIAVDRLFQVKNLKNKYGTDVPGVIAMVRPFAVKVGFDQLR